MWQEKRLLTDPEAETSSYEKGADGIDIANAVKMVLFAPNIVEAMVGGGRAMGLLKGTLPANWEEQWGDAGDLRSRSSGRDSRPKRSVR